MSAERFLKTLHGWLGVLILPWVVLAGLTGLYENHSRLVLGWMPLAIFSTDMLDTLPQTAVGPGDAMALSARLLVGPTAPPREDRFQSRAVYRVQAETQTLYLDRATGAYWLRGAYVQTLYDPAGARMATTIRWSNFLSHWHRRGWTSDRFGTWPADLTAGALTVFGLSGLYLFFAPRLRRLRNRRARLRGPSVKTP